MEKTRLIAYGVGLSSATKIRRGGERTNPQLLGTLDAHTVYLSKLDTRVRINVAPRAKTISTAGNHARLISHCIRRTERARAVASKQRSLTS